MRRCLHCGAKVSGGSGPCPACGVAEPFKLRFQGRGRTDDTTLRFDGPPAAWLSQGLVILGHQNRWQCHICRLPVARACPPDHHAAPSRDHIVPRRHERGLHRNVMLAHKWCNSERADRPMACLDVNEFQGRLLLLVPELKEAA